MTLDDARKRLFAYAVDRLGTEEVAKRLDTSPPSLDAWTKGAAQPPTRVVMALADLVYELQKAGG